MVGHFEPGEGEGSESALPFEPSNEDESAGESPHAPLQSTEEKAVSSSNPCSSRNVQLLLSLNRRDASDLVAAKAALIEALSGRGWVTARQLRVQGFDDRLLRAIVEDDADGQILSYPGSPGYRLFDEATLPEIEKAEALRSQAKGMLRRFVRYQRRRHGKAVRP